MRNIRMLNFAPVKSWQPFKLIVTNITLNDTPKLYILTLNDTGYLTDSHHHDNIYNRVFALLLWCNIWIRNGWLPPENHWIITGNCEWWSSANNSLPEELLYVARKC